METLQINSIHDVRSFLYYLMVEMELGAGFHPDTPMYDYVRINPDHPGEEQLTFAPEFADVLQGQLIQCCRVCDKSNADIYLITMEMGRMLGYAPAIEENGEKQPADIDWNAEVARLGEMREKAIQYITTNSGIYPKGEEPWYVTQCHFKKANNMPERDIFAAASLVQKAIAERTKP